MKFHQDRIIFSRVIVFTSYEGDFNGNDVTDDVTITKFNWVHSYLPRNNPAKFHRDRIRFSQVIVFTSSENSFNGNDVTDDGVLLKPGRRSRPPVAAQCTKMRLVENPVAGREPKIF